MALLSAVIITLNEETQVGRCIDSVQGVADEVVVLDSYSTDGTEKVCRAKGAIFHQQKFSGYVDQKNSAMHLASHDLVLSLDADEALSQELRSSILAIKQNPDAAGYSMNRLNNYCGTWIRHSGWYPDRKVRMADRRKAIWEGAQIHEKLNVKEGVLRHLEGDILHYSYHSISEHVIQANKFTDISAKAMYEQGRKAPLWRLVVNPALMFLKCYFLRAGFLDGFYGYTISRISTQATYLKYAKLRQLWINAKNEVPNGQ